MRKKRVNNKSHVLIIQNTIAVKRNKRIQIFDKKYKSVF